VITTDDGSTCPTFRPAPPTTVTGMSMRFQSRRDDQEIKRTNEFNGNININNGLDELSVQDSLVSGNVSQSCQCRDDEPFWCPQFHSPQPQGIEPRIVVMVLIAPITVTAIHGFRLKGVFSAYVMVMMKCTWNPTGRQILLENYLFNSSICSSGWSNGNLQHYRNCGLWPPLILNSRVLY